MADEKTITIIYNQNKVRDKKIVETLKSGEIDLKEIMINDEKLRTKELHNIIPENGNEIKDLLDERLVEGLEIRNNREAIKLINSNPLVLKTPVIIKKDHAKCIDSTSEAEKLLAA